MLQALQVCRVSLFPAWYNLFSKWLSSLVTIDKGVGSFFIKFLYPDFSSEKKTVIDKENQCAE